MPDDTKKQKRSFEVNGTKYAVRMPTVDEIKGANETRAKTFNEALSRGDLLRDQLEGELRKRKLWTDERERIYQTLRTEVLDGEFRLKRGGIKLSEAKSLALEMGEKRNEMVELLSSRTDLDSNTCEGRADAARFNYLYAHCLVYDETDEPYFANGIDDYLANTEDEVAGAGATEFYYLISGTENVDSTLPENQFLHKFKFVNDDLKLIDKAGKLINQDGKHIDEYGNFITWNKDGTSTKVDPTGRPVTDEGRFFVEHSAFLDESGKEIDESLFEKSEVLAEDEKAEEKPKTRKRTKKTVESKT